MQRGGEAGPEKRWAPMPVVVGVGRSGTTLLRLMLDAHPELAIPSETGFLLDLAELRGDSRQLREGAYKAITDRENWPRMGISRHGLRRSLDAIEPFEMAEGIRAFYHLYADRFGKPRWGDKTPYYLSHIDEIERLLPESRFIHVIRDGRDVAISVQGLWFAPGDSMRAIARDWVSGIRIGRRLGARARHYLEVRYEALLRDPGAELRRICDFIELDYDERMLAYADTARERLGEMVPPGMMDKPANELPDIIRYATMPPQRSRSQRWREEMGRRERLAFERVAGRLLDELGYESTLPGRRLLRRARQTLGR